MHWNLFYNRTEKVANIYERTQRKSFYFKKFPCHKHTKKNYTLKYLLRLNKTFFTSVLFRFLLKLNFYFKKAALVSI